MPPIAALRMSFTLAITQQIPDMNGKLIAKHETPACFHRCEESTLLVASHAGGEYWWNLHQKQVYGPDVVGLLKKCLYGTRDAPGNWEAAICAVMTTMRFARGKSNSCGYYHPEKQIRVEVHGDDFTRVGSKSNLDWFAEELKEHWTIDARGILGPPGMEGVKQPIVFLNR